MSFAFAVCLAIALVNPPVTEKEKAMAVTGTATAETTSMTITNLDGLASVEFSALDPMGSFATSSAEESVSFTLTTNNYTGYTLGIVAEDDNGFLAATANPGETPDTLASIGEITATSDFSAATTDAAENYNGKWGFRPSKYVSGNDVITNDSDDPVYFPSPTTTPTMLDKTSAANAADASNEYTIALGVRANYTIHSGQYSRVFQLMVLANPVSYSVAYNKNTADTVTGMPSTQASSSMIETSLTLSNAVPTRDHYSFIGWCSTTTTATNGVDSCSGTIYNPNGGGTNLTYGIDKTTTNETTLYAMWKIDSFVQTTEVRYENADGTWGNYATVDTATVNYGSSYAWSTAQITGFNSTVYQAASVSSYTVTTTHTNQISIYRNTFTCSKQYRLENANGTWGNYTSDGSETVRYGGSCSYSKSVTNYRGSSSVANNAQGSASASNVTSNQMLSISFYRNTFTLTVTASTNTSSATGGGTYRWGQSVTVGVTKAANVTCTSYATPAWTATAGTAPAAGASTTYTMPASNATVTATSAASNVAQTVSLSRSGGANGITIAGTKYTGSSVSLACGTYSISGSFDSGYEFSAWGRGNNVTVASTSTNSTTMTVSGPGSLSLTGKSKIYLQNVTASTCPTTATTAYDKRDEQAYTIQKLADNKCWLLDNLALGAVTLTEAISSSNTNIPSGVSFTLPASISSGFGSFTAAQINTASYTSTYSYGSGSGKVGVYYNYCAATAGGICTNSNSSNASADRDICPKGWRLPTGGPSGEYQALYTAYSSNATNFKNALRTPLSGYFNYSSAFYQGSDGYFWSATRNDDNLMYTLIVSSSTVNPQNNRNRGNGFSVRCVLK